MLEMSEDLAHGKDFCISTILKCLDGDAPTIGSVLSGFGPSLQEWLLSLESTVVIAIYHDLNEQIQHRNGFVVPTNAMLHNAMGSSTNAMLLGNSQQSCASLFYVVPYLCKNKVALESCLLALEQAQQHVEKYPSQNTIDTGTDKRYVQHMFTHVVNDLSRCMQLSDTQIALSLLNMGTEVCTDSFKYFGADYCVNYFLHSAITEDTSHEEHSSDDGDNSSFSCDDDFLDDDSTNVLCDNVSEDFGNDNDSLSLIQEDPDVLPSPDHKSFGPAPFYKIKRLSDDIEFSDDEDEDMPESKSIPVYYPTHWWYRGEELCNLTQMEYYALVDIVPLSRAMENQKNDEDEDDNAGEQDATKGLSQQSTNPGTANCDSQLPSSENKDGVPPCSEKQKPGRKQRDFFKFHSKHPLYHSHAQCLRAKQPTLILHGHAPKYPGKPPLAPPEDACTFEKEQGDAELALWKKNAKLYAQFYTVCFLPHLDHYGNPPKFSKDYLEHYLSWESFSARIQTMEETGNLIDRLRLDTMYTFMYGFRSDRRKNVLLSNFRHRNTTKWSDQDKKAAAQMYASIGATNAKFTNDDDDDEGIWLTTKQFPSKKTTELKENSKFYKTQLKSLADLYPPIESMTAPSISSNSPPLPDNPQQTILRYEQDAVAVCERAANLSTAEIVRDFGPKRSSKRSRHGHFLGNSLEPAKTYTSSRKLSNSQTILVDAIFGYFTQVQHYKNNKGANKVTLKELNENNIPPPNFLVTGDPGSGKTYATETVCQLATIMKLGFVGTTSYNGIAAVNVDGNTVSSMFCIYDTSDAGGRIPLTDDRILRMRNTMDSENMCFLILDEVSTIDSRIIAVIDFRLQQIFDDASPFGGMPILFAGDFNQLGAVKKVYLPRDMITWALRLKKAGTIKNPPLPTSAVTVAGSAPVRDKSPGNMGKSFARHKKLQTKNKNQIKKELNDINRFKPSSPSYRGCYLFSKFLRFHLVEQQRTNDLQHAAFVQKLSRGENILLSDILSYNPLSNKDITEHPEVWKYAPILVSTNIERLNICRFKAKMWATEHKSFVFRWKVKVRRQENRPPIQHRQTIIVKNAFFWQFWVAGAPSNLTYNVNGNMALVNGAPITTHSLSYSDRQEYDRILGLTQGPDALPFGSEIEIDTPLAANMIMNKSLDDKEVSEYRQMQLDHLKVFSIFSGKETTVIPLTAATKKQEKYRVFAYPTGDAMYPVGTAEVCDQFKFELGFCITVHKAQGRTISRVIIDLTSHATLWCQMEFAAIFVAMSRVTQKSHIRLLTHAVQGKQFNPADAYSYLTGLKPSAFAMALYHGYTETPNSLITGMKWNPSTALDYSTKTN